MNRERIDYPEYGLVYVRYNPDIVSAEDGYAPLTKIGSGTLGRVYVRFYMNTSDYFGQYVQHATYLCRYPKLVEQFLHSRFSRDRKKQPDKWFRPNMESDSEFFLVEPEEPEDLLDGLVMNPVLEGEKLFIWRFSDVWAYGKPRNDYEFQPKRGKRILYANDTERRDKRYVMYRYNDEVLEHRNMNNFAQFCAHVNRDWPNFINYIDDEPFTLGLSNVIPGLDPNKRDQWKNGFDKT